MLPDSRLLAVLVTAAVGVNLLNRSIRAWRTLCAVALVPIAARRLSIWLKARDYDQDRFFSVDGAGAFRFTVHRRQPRPVSARASWTSRRSSSAACTSS